eukprot:6052700-Pleurochrysis_carterae.AAC.1
MLHAPPFLCQLFLHRGVLSSVSLPSLQQTTIFLPQTACLALDLSLCVSVQPCGVTLHAMRTLKMRVEAEMMQRKVRKSANGRARSTPRTAASRQHRSRSLLDS